jgi:hypothetical protein
VIFFSIFKKYRNKKIAGELRGIDFLHYPSLYGMPWELKRQSSFFCQALIF